MSGAHATGVYDAATKRTVLVFQKDMAAYDIDRGVPQNGFAGFETFDALWTCTYVGGRPLQEGADGIDTLWLQRFLTMEGAYHGAPDGLFGPETRDAVIAFQEASSLDPDGVVGPATVFAIGSNFKRHAGVWP